MKLPNPFASLIPGGQSDAGVDQHLLAKGINAFGSALAEKIEEKSPTGDAMFLSPWGIAHALAMVLEGAEPGSASHTQLLSTVFALQDANGFASSLKSLAGTVTAANNDNDLTVSDANSAWVKPSLHLLDSYVKALEENFAAQARPLSGAAEVNSWVEKATHGKIKTIIDEGTAQQAALVLVNAIYFKGMWEEAFEKTATSPLPFHLMDGSTEVQASMMYVASKKGAAVKGAKLQATLPDGKPIDCVAAKLAYRGGAFSAVIAMPAAKLAENGSGAGDSLLLEGGVEYRQALSACRSAVTTSLRGGNALQWIAPGEHRDVEAVKVYLPRFEIEYKASLADALKAAGAGRMFVPGDLTKIAKESDLVVSDVIHKVFVKVDEEGTEAAAVTAVVMMRAAFRPSPEMLMVFDRPFVFSVVHEATGLALFTGEVYKPEAWKN